MSAAKAAGSVFFSFPSHTTHKLLRGSCFVVFFRAVVAGFVVPGVVTITGP